MDQEVRPASLQMTKELELMRGQNCEKSLARHLRPAKLHIDWSPGDQTLNSPLSLLSSSKMQKEKTDADSMSCVEREQDFGEQAMAVVANSYLSSQNIQLRYNRGVLADAICEEINSGIDCDCQLSRPNARATMLRWSWEGRYAQAEALARMLLPNLPR